MTKQTDGLDALADKLAIRRSGWHRHENSETGAVVLFPSVPVYQQGSPEQRALEDAWQVKAVAQAAESERMERATRLEPKPRQNTMTRVTRGD